MWVMVVVKAVVRSSVVVCAVSGVVAAVMVGGAPAWTIAIVMVIDMLDDLLVARLGASISCADLWDTTVQARSLYASLCTLRL